MSSSLISMIIGVVVSAGLSSSPAQVLADPNFVSTPGVMKTADPNALLVKEDPNNPKQLTQQAIPASAKQTQSVIPGTLALNWLYQGKEPPKPQVGNETVTFVTEVRPWPYGYCDNDWLYNRPWQSSYEYWARYRNNFNTYPVNHAAVRMTLDASLSFEFGAYSAYDLAGPYYRP